MMVLSLKALSTSSTVETWIFSCWSWEKKCSQHMVSRGGMKEPHGADSSESSGFLIRKRACGEGPPHVIEIVRLQVLQIYSELQAVICRVAEARRQISGGKWAACLNRHFFRNRRHPRHRDTLGILNRGGAMDGGDEEQKRKWKSEMHFLSTAGDRDAMKSADLERLYGQQ